MQLKMFWPLIFLFFLICWPGTKIWALKVDEKLTLRFLKVSDSKKTILINRGIEDGLVVGDHAKFFTTTGVIARGVLLKSSPSRSVWSLYQLIDEKEIIVDKVLNLKISEAVKLTQDLSKMFHGEDGPVPPPAGIMLADGAEDDDASLSGSEKQDLNQLNAEGTSGGKDAAASGINTETFLSQKTMEFWGLIHLTSLSSSNSYGSTATGTTSAVEGLDFVLGLEKYFQDYQSFIGKISLLPFFHYAKYEYSNIQGHTVKNGIFAFGGGIHYHFLAPPLSVNRAILFVGINVGSGTSTDEAVLQGSSSSGALPSIDGKLTFFSVGSGFKFYTPMGIGVRIFADYYRRVETYSVNDSTSGISDEFTKTISGPRILLGLSYRF